MGQGGGRGVVVDGWACVVMCVGRGGAGWAVGLLAESGGGSGTRKNPRTKNHASPV